MGSGSLLSQLYGQLIVPPLIVICGRGSPSWTRLLMLSLMQPLLPWACVSIGFSLVSVPLFIVNLGDASLLGNILMMLCSLLSIANSTAISPPPLLSYSVNSPLKIVIREKKLARLVASILILWPFRSSLWLRRTSISSSSPLSV